MFIIQHKAAFVNDTHKTGGGVDSGYNAQLYQAYWLLLQNSLFVKMFKKNIKKKLKKIKITIAIRKKVWYN